VIICYDGTRPATDALVTAAELLPGATAIVVTVWKPILEAILAVTLGPAPPISDPADADERQRRAAVTISRDGARLASEAGLKAEPLPVKASGAVWETVEKIAREKDARLVVCGAGRTGVKSALLDTVPTALVHRGSRPALVVPSTQAASERQAGKTRS
jgi:nucleotide-binding universal stress UspA family protein